MDLDFNVMDYAPGNKPATDPNEEKKLRHLMRFPQPEIDMQN